MKNKEIKQILLQMDIKLYQQLKEYADRENDSNVSMTARKAIRKFINEVK